MSDILPLPDFLADANDEELVFEDAAPVAAAAEATPAPRARRGRKSAAPLTPDAAVQAVIDGLPDFPADMAAAPTPEPVQTHVAPPPAQPRTDGSPASKVPVLLIAITLFALLTSLVSLGGLIAVGRTLAHVEAERQHSEDERRAFAEAPALVARLTQIGARLDGAAQRYAAAAPSGPPASVADIRHELDVLRFALSQRQPDPVSSLGGITRSGFSELATKIDLLQAQIAGRGATRPAPGKRVARQD